MNAGGVDQVEVAVIGAGLAGSCLAGALARAGIRVALIDAQAGHAAARREFRAEKFGADQMALFAGLGFGPALRARTTETREVAVVRYGRLACREAAREWGAPYPVLVRAVREALPAGLLRPGRVADLALGPERQEITLGDGSRLAARLVVLATGLGQALHARAGLRRRVLSPRHSLAAGFDMAAPRDRFPFPALTYFSEGFGGRDAYLTLFPLGTVMRANLFCYRDPGEAWVADLRRDPAATLRATMPRLPAACPDLAVAGPLEIRPIDLVRTEGVERDGLVVIGDAFQTACPVTGTGIGKLLTDADRLARVHVPAWLATPGMGRDKIAAFYADPVKRACDARSLRASRYARGLAVETGALWRARRLRNRVARTAIRLAADGPQAAASLALSLALGL
ncbi:FAD-dependent oxidoreductase [Methylobacterium sp. NMS14P]|uniref:FAD-dependent oxidoreductase n=1 Tax=Methylobacterium sp. NMS14P TaxID=2894310 RepID=UPI002358479F|nr:NAD(P)/FAD-dependent oxidoreductase [Methylobacterium sp. NMS14P]